jgi:AraC-like DNA-binding protein
MDLERIKQRLDDSKLQAGALCSSGLEIDSPWHRHDMHQLLYAFQGALTVEGKSGRYKVPRQFAVWIPAGVAHRTTIQRVASGSVYLSRDLLPCSAKTPRVIVAPMLMRQMVMHAMRWPLDRSEDDATSSIYFQCFAKLCEEWIEDEVKLVLPASDQPRIARIMDFTQSHIATVTLADVCKSVGISERSLRRQFASTVGMSWEEYRQRLRIHLALDDLDDTTKSIGTIAADSGYENPAAFARAFRSIMGMSPSEYRRPR